MSHTGTNGQTNNLQAKFARLDFSGYIYINEHEREREPIAKMISGQLKEKFSGDREFFWRSLPGVAINIDCGGYDKLVYTNEIHELFRWDEHTETFKVHLGKHLARGSPPHHDSLPLITICELIRLLCLCIQQLIWLDFSVSTRFV
jgi:hypothetical protein